MGQFMTEKYTELNAQQLFELGRATMQEIQVEEYKCSIGLNNEVSVARAYLMGGKIIALTCFQCGNSHDALSKQLPGIQKLMR